MNLHSLKIKCPEGEISSGNNTEIFLDGKPLNGVTQIEVKILPFEMVKVFIELNVENLEVDIPGVVESPKNKNLLVVDVDGKEVGKITL